MVTIRDEIWSTTLQLLEFQRSFTTADVLHAINGESPSSRTVRNTLDAMETLGFLRSEGGTGRAPREYYPVKPDTYERPEGYSPRQTIGTSTIPYPGGKGRLAEWVISNMPAHDTYVEVFGGGAGVLYNKPRSKYEIYNDVDNDLTQFFSVLRDRPDELANWLITVPYSRDLYERWVTAFYNGVRPDDAIERAGRFFTLRYMQFIGISSAPNGFKTRARRSPARTFDNARDRIEMLANRFSQVTIENQDYRAIFDTYDDTTVDVLFYVDPPYVGTESHYGADFNHNELIRHLETVESDWMLSYSRLPESLDDHTIIERESRHRMKRSAGEVTEKLVCNFNPDHRQPFE